MKIVKKYYFDANALVKYYKASVDYYENEKGCEQIVDLVSISKPIFISPLTLIETIGFFTKFIFRSQIGKKSRKKRLNELDILMDFLQRNIGHNGDNPRPFQMITMPEGIFQLAESILLENADAAIQTNDALHLAIVKKQINQTIMVTSDGAMKNVCAQVNIPIYDPELKTE